MPGRQTSTTDGRRRTLRSGGPVPRRIPSGALSLLAVLLLLLACQGAWAGIAVCLSEVTILDTRPPAIALLAPGPGELLIQGTEFIFRWQVDEEHFAPDSTPLSLEIIVGGEVLLSELFAAEPAGDYELSWTVAAEPTDRAYWQVAAVDAFGNEGHIMSEPFTIAPEGTGSPATLPERLAICPNFPNPFNPVTTLRFALPAPGPVRLLIYDARGRRVDLLLAGHRERGWHELHWRAAGQASGIYFARLEFAGETLTRKLLLLK